MEHKSFAQFHKETTEEILKFIKEKKTDEFMTQYLDDKLNTAHLYGLNEAESIKRIKIK